jgi:hypothetical protein
MGPVGKDKLVFDTTVTLSENDNVGAYLTDAAGNLLTSTLVGAKQSLDVNVTDSPDQYQEDSTHASGDIGSFVLGVRNDANAVLTSADGDYSALSVDDTGRLKVDISTITATSSLTVNPGTPANWGIYAEDSASASGDKGVFILAVRNDVEGSLVSADGDYGALQLDSLGRLRVAADISVVSGFEKAEDSAHSSGDIGGYMLSVRQDTLATSTSADGDYQSFKTDSVGALWTRQSTATPAPNSSILVTSTNVDNTVGGTAIPATPLANRKSIIVQNLGNKEIFIGPSGVTTATGLRIAAGGSVELEIGPSIALYAIGASASLLAVKTLEIA